MKFTGRHEAVLHLEKSRALIAAPVTLEGRVHEIMRSSHMSISQRFPSNRRKHRQYSGRPLMRVFPHLEGAGNNALARARKLTGAMRAAAWLLRALAFHARIEALYRI